MGEFFRGWRRRSGLAALAIALALMGGWMRSFVYCEIISFRRDPHHIHMIFSNNAAVGWASLESEDDLGDFYEIADVQINVWEGTKTEWHWNWFGFDFGKSIVDSTNESFALWSIPYWAFTFPMTLITAFLLLKRPCTSTVKVARPSE